MTPLRMTAAQVAALHALAGGTDHEVRIGTLSTRFGSGPEDVIWALVGGGAGHFIRKSGETWAVNHLWQPVQMTAPAAPSQAAKDA